MNTQKLTEKDLEDLNLFKEKAEILFESKTILDGIIQNKLKLNLLDINANFEINLPNSDQISVLLHRIRPFILEKEATFFNKIKNILYKILDKESQDELKSISKRFEHKNNLPDIEFFEGCQNIKTDTNFYNWVNAEEYHSDKKKKEEVELLRKSLPNNLFYHQMIEIYIDKYNAIFGLFQIIKNQKVLK
ncbi:hypothetical protein N5T78_08210 [Aliarcobacter cryaerophilus]|uniref:hypothetical protein n=1 Tax=Aliarcobacter cryaerophilus TaxID=28198 RepID=UPI0021B6E1D0|nr:hypothetical protein [Aliarcobacter cryaerophilus]MCT7466558.1 hypothetical protein [Aliarcobacter cryaerophilus]